MQILVTDPIADAGIDQLRDAGATVTIDTDLSGDSLAAAIGGVDALLVRSGTAVTAAVFDAADRLQFVGRAGIGVDNIDIEAATAAYDACGMQARYVTFTPEETALEEA
ncbi:MAG: hypothetical protein RI544_07795, partial [Haloquadratum sp.]|nr:hypothetical protein [Haloquadratum sp.]